MNDGWAVPYDQRFVTVHGVDFKNLKEVAGDFDADQLDEILAQREQLLSLVRPTLDLVGNRRTIIFNPGVNMAKLVASTINSEPGYNESAMWLSGEVSEERQDIYRRHQKGQFQFLSVCGLCIAKGSLIFTDRGEVPIEQITTEMKLWDGVEFVSHDGVISNGLRPVIEYAGLKATGDHNVWTDAGWERLSTCKKLGVAIRVSAIGRRAVRESCGYYRNNYSTWKRSPSRTRGAMRWLRSARVGSQRAQTWPGRLQALFKSSGVPEWLLMRCRSAKKRCENPKDKHYGDYGGRGIEFRFASPTQMGLWIMADLGLRRDLSLDRKDNNGHYEPGNIAWASNTEQANNRRRRRPSTSSTRDHPSLHRQRTDRL